jgi:serine/threonine protein kinase/predicted ATPase
MIQARQETIGPYRVLGVLGRGGMGVVYRCERLDTGAPAAVKTVSVPEASMLASIRREIHALARIRHPGVVRVLDEGLEAGVPWYAMELLQGVSLRRACAELAGFPDTAASTGPLPPTRTLLDADTPEPWWTQSLAPGTRRISPPAGVVGPAATPGPAARLRPPAAGGALPQILSLVRRLCTPLAFLHGEGIVHRDLKPENILITGRRQKARGRRQKARGRRQWAEGRRQAQETAPPPASCLLPPAFPVLVDFGLVARFGSREALEAAGGAAGTLEYMAPEQILGDLVDARADLYALGCILYELLTGRRPFQGRTGAEVIRAHLRTGPPPPSELVEGVPPQLDALVLALLAKRPQDRLGHATDLAAALVELGAEAEPVDPGPRPKAYLYRPGFFGRDAALGELCRRLEALASGAGAVVLVGGESGVGKTRLILEMAREAERREMPVLTGQCQPLSSEESGAEPLGPLRRALQSVADRCREHGPAETLRLLGRNGRLLALYEPALGSVPGLETQPEPPELPPDAARQRLDAALAETFGALAEGRGLVLVLDDLQWADELTLGFLESLLRFVSGGVHGRARLLAVGAYRSEEVGQRPASPLRRLLDAPAAVRLELPRLEQTAVGDMVRDMLALAAAPEAFARFLARHSEGNPFFVAEYLRVAVAEGLLYRDAAGMWQVAEEGEEEATEAVYAALPLPGSVRELVGRRLAGLSEPARGLLEAACVLGREADTELALRLAEQAGLPGAAVHLEALDELIRRQVLEETGAGRLRFVHDKIREAAYERLGPRLRTGLHRAAALSIEARFRDAREEHLAELGSHWEHAGCPARARRFYLQGARRAWPRYAHKEAERLYRAFLSLVEVPDVESVSARNELARQVLTSCGRYAEAEAEFQRASQEAHGLGDPDSEGVAFLGLAIVQRFQSRAAEAQASFESCLGLFRKLGRRDREAEALSNLAIFYHNQGRFEEAQGLFEEAAATFRTLGNRSSEASNLSNLAELHFQQGRVETARSLREEALALSRQLGDRRMEGITLGNLANFDVHQGRFEAAASRYEEALAIHRRIGNRISEGVVLGNLANVRFSQGRIEEATALYEQALAIQRGLGDRRGEANTLNNLALLASEQGRIEEATALYDSSMQAHQATGSTMNQAQTLCFLATLVRRAYGDLDRAEHLLDQAEVWLRQTGHSTLALCLCERGHVALARGRSGRGALQEARETAERMRAGPESQSGAAIAQLERAVAEFEAGRPLFQGECVQDLPQGLRRRLVEDRGQEPRAGGA